jgi:hypothetical protein
MVMFNIIGTDQNFNFLDIERRNNAQDLLNVFINNDFIPTITKATRICHSTSTLIDNIYIKLRADDEITSGILTTYISDHLPIFVLMGRPTPMKRMPQKITYRPMDDSRISNMVNYLENYNWASLDETSVSEANDIFIKIVNDALDQFAPEKTITIPYKNILREPWMTPAMLKSSKTRDKMYRKSIGKSKNNPMYIDFIRYRNFYNKLKKVCKQTHYARQLSLYKNDVRRTWKILREVIGKQNDKSKR